MVENINEILNQMVGVNHHILDDQFSAYMRRIKEIPVLINTDEEGIRNNDNNATIPSSSSSSSSLLKLSSLYNVKIDKSLLHVWYTSLNICIKLGNRFRQAKTFSDIIFSHVLTHTSSNTDLNHKSYNNGVEYTGQYKQDFYDILLYICDDIVRALNNNNINNINNSNSSKNSNSSSNSNSYNSHRMDTEINGSSRNILDIPIPTLNECHFSTGGNGSNRLFVVKCHLHHHSAFIIFILCMLEKSMRYIYSSKNPRRKALELLSKLSLLCAGLRSNMTRNIVMCTNNRQHIQNQMQIEESWLPTAVLAQICRCLELAITANSTCYDVPDTEKVMNTIFDCVHQITTQFCHVDALWTTNYNLPFTLVDGMKGFTNQLVTCTQSFCTRTLPASEDVCSYTHVNEADSFSIKRLAEMCVATIITSLEKIASLQAFNANTTQHTNQGESLHEFNAALLHCLSYFLTLVPESCPSLDFLSRSVSYPQIHRQALKQKQIYQVSVNSYAGCVRCLASVLHASTQAATTITSWVLTFHRNSGSSSTSNLWIDPYQDICVESDGLVNVNVIGRNILMGVEKMLNLHKEDASLSEVVLIPYMLLMDTVTIALSRCVGKSSNNVEDDTVQKISTFYIDLSLKFSEVAYIYGYHLRMLLLLPPSVLWDPSFRQLYQRTIQKIYDANHCSDKVTVSVTENAILNGNLHTRLTKFICKNSEDKQSEKFSTTRVFELLDIVDEACRVEHDSFLLQVMKNIPIMKRDSDIVMGTNGTQPALNSCQFPTINSDYGSNTASTGSPDPITNTSFRGTSNGHSNSNSNRYSLSSNLYDLSKEELNMKLRSICVSITLVSRDIDSPTLRTCAHMTISKGEILRNSWQSLGDLCHHFESICEFTNNSNSHTGIGSSGSDPSVNINNSTTDIPNQESMLSTAISMESLESLMYALESLARVTSHIILEAMLQLGSTNNRNNIATECDLLDLLCDMGLSNNPLLHQQTLASSSASQSRSAGPGNGSSSSTVGTLPTDFLEVCCAFGAAASYIQSISFDVDTSVTDDPLKNNEGKISSNIYLRKSMQILVKDMLDILNKSAYLRYFFNTLSDWIHNKIISGSTSPFALGSAVPDTALSPEGMAHVTRYLRLASWMRLLAICLKCATTLTPMSTYDGTAMGKVSTNVGASRKKSNEKENIPKNSHTAAMDVDSEDGGICNPEFEVDLNVMFKHVTHDSESLMQLMNVASVRAQRCLTCECVTLYTVMLVSETVLQSDISNVSNNNNNNNNFDDSKERKKDRRNKAETIGIDFHSLTTKCPSWRLMRSSLDQHALSLSAAKHLTSEEDISLKIRALVDVVRCCAMIYPEMSIEALSVIIQAWDQFDSNSRCYYIFFDNLHSLVRKPFNSIRYFNVIAYLAALYPALYATSIICPLLCEYSRHARDNEEYVRDAKICHFIEQILGEHKIESYLEPLQMYIRPHAVMTGDTNVFRAFEDLYQQPNSPSDHIKDKDLSLHTHTISATSGRGVRENVEANTMKLNDFMDEYLMKELLLSNLVTKADIKELLGVGRLTFLSKVLDLCRQCGARICTPKESDGFLDGDGCKKKNEVLLHILWELGGDDESYKKAHKALLLFCPFCVTKSWNYTLATNQKRPPKSKSKPKSSNQKQQNDTRVITNNSVSSSSGRSTSNNPEDHVATYLSEHFLFFMNKNQSKNMPTIFHRERGLKILMRVLTFLRQQDVVGYLPKILSEINVTLSDPSAILRRMGVRLIEVVAKILPMEVLAQQAPALVTGVFSIIESPCNIEGNKDPPPKVIESLRQRLFSTVVKCIPPLTNYPHDQVFGQQTINAQKNLHYLDSNSHLILKVCEIAYCHRISRRAHVEACTHAEEFITYMFSLSSNPNPDPNDFNDNDANNHITDGHMKVADALRRRVPFIPLSTSINSSSGKDGLHAIREAHNKSRTSLSFQDELELLSVMLTDEAMQMRKIALRHFLYLCSGVSSSFGTAHQDIEGKEIDVDVVSSRKGGKDCSDHRRQLYDLMSAATQSVGAGGGGSELNNATTMGKIYDALLYMCVLETEDDVRSLCAACIGEIGALDPTRASMLLPHQNRGSGSLRFTRSRYSNKSNAAADIAEGNSTHVNVGHTTTTMITNATNSSNNTANTAAKSRELDSKPPFLVDRLNFGLDLLEFHLVPSMHMDSKDTIEFAIQSILEELHKCLKSLEVVQLRNGAGGDSSISLLSSATPSTQTQNDSQEDAGPMPAMLRQLLMDRGILDMCEPFWYTTYRIDVKAATNAQDTESLIPIAFTSYERWTFRFMKLLSQSCTGPLSAFFKAVRGVRKIPELNVFLLPYILVDVLISEGTNSRQKQWIGEQINGVLERRCGIRARTSSTAADSHKLSHSASQIQTQSQSETIADLSCLALFSLMEKLNSWSVMKVPELIALKSIDEGTNQEFWAKSAEHLQSFLSDISYELMARSALCINANARALRYFELFTRARAKISDAATSGSTNVTDATICKTNHAINAITAVASTQNLPQFESSDGSNSGLPALSAKDLNELLLIYCKLGDTDSVKGVQMLRQIHSYDSTGEHRIIEKQHTEDWNDALAEYDMELEIRRRELQKEEAKEAKRNRLSALSVHSVQKSKRVVDEGGDIKRDGGSNREVEGMEVVGHGGTRGIILPRAPKKARIDPNANKSHIDAYMDSSSSNHALTDKLFFQETMHLEKGRYRCLIEIGSLSAALEQFQGVTQDCVELEQALLPLAVESSWRLQSWDKMGELLRSNASVNSCQLPSGFASRTTKQSRLISPPSQSATNTAVSALSSTGISLHSEVEQSEIFQVNLGRLFLLWHQRNRHAFEHVLRSARLNTMAALRATVGESYQRSYPHLVQLQILHELDTGFDLPLTTTQVEMNMNMDTNDRMNFTNVQNPMMVNDVVRRWQWDRRLELMSPSLRDRSMVMAVRRSIFASCGLQDYAANSWLTLSREYRAAGKTSLARNALRNASLPMTLSSSSSSSSSSRSVPLFMSQHSNQPPSSTNTPLQHAQHISPEILLIEECEILKASGQVNEALLLLEPVEYNIPGCLQLLRQGDLKFNSERDKEHFSSKLLLATKLMVDSDRKQGQVIMDRYTLAIELKAHPEQAHFELARYSERLYHEAKRVSPIEDEISCNYVYNAVSHYGKCIQSQTQSGQSNVHLDLITQALPRMLTLWFSFTALTDSSNSTSSVASGLQLDSTSIDSNPFASNPHNNGGILAKWKDELNKRLMEKFVKRISPSVWYTCLPQIASRCEHPNKNTRKQVVTILIAAIESFPRQAIWHVAGLMLSLKKDRRHFAQSVLHDVQRRFQSQSRDRDRKRQSNSHGHSHSVPSNDQEVLLKEACELFQSLVDLSQQIPSNPKDKKMKCKFRPLNARWLVPTQSALQIVFPSPNPTGGDATSGLGNRIQSPSSSSSSSGVVTSAADLFFPSNQMMLLKFKETVDVCNSKARPKIITIYTVCGRTLQFLCKQEKNGDLRKDARMMEFCSVINRLLAADMEGRKRSLRLRTYSVICLNEEAGILEFIPKTTTLRSLIMDSHRQTPRTPFPDHKLIYDSFVKFQRDYEADLNGMVKQYRNLILDWYRPAFHRWFLSNFPDPADWIDARLLYTRSTAVWSVVGHIAGLGDRHTENMLLDRSSGEMCHVDFDCLFDKGLILQRPEIIPFRLTPNLVDAMGVTGFRGTFRATMEVSLEVLRKNRDTLMASLEPFIRDPTVAWGRSGRAQKSDSEMRARQSRALGVDLGGDGNADAQRVLTLISGRLNGAYNIVHPKADLIRAKYKQRGEKNLPRFGLGASKDEANVIGMNVSVAGQVDRLILEAIALESLAQSYMGWMPWL